MVLFYKMWKKYNEIQLKKMDLNNLKMTNHPPFPDISIMIAPGQNTKLVCIIQI